MTDLSKLLHDTADLIADYRAELKNHPVGPAASRAEVRRLIPAVLPDSPMPAAKVIDELVAAARPGLVASAGPRYFGFVLGGTLDAALAADMLTSGWDQVAFNEATSPAAIAFEDAAGNWLKQLLGIPANASVGFVTGGQAGNTVGIACGRWKVLMDAGWDVGRQGLNGAPPVRVIVGAERHATIDRAVRLLGLGECAIESISALADGSMDPAALAAAFENGPPGPAIVCAQAGNVNSGAFDDLARIAQITRPAGAWLHVDGAFGLWAAANPRTRHLVGGVELADSWSVDGHKWLNVPYDSGYVLCAHPDVHATTMAYTAEYLTGQTADREFGGGDFAPESSRRARGFATWAALRSLGKTGIADLVERNCALARQLAAGLEAIDGIEVVNEVVLNQVLVCVGDAENTDRLQQHLAREGTLWCGATTWHERRLLRFAVSGWSTSTDDIERCVGAIANARDTVLAD